MSLKTYRWMILAAVLLCGCLPLLGELVSELIPSSKQQGSLQEIISQAANEAQRHGVPITLRAVLRQSGTFIAGAAGIVLLFIGARQLTFKKCLPLMLCIPAGQAFCFFAPLLWTVLTTHTAFFSPVDFLRLELLGQMQPVPVAVIWCAGALAAYLAAHKTAGRREVTGFLLAAAAGIGAFLVIGFALKAVNSLFFEDNTAWVADFYRALLLLPFQWAAALTALFLARKEGGLTKQPDKA